MNATTNMFLLVKYNKTYGLKQIDKCALLANKFSAVRKDKMAFDW